MTPLKLAKANAYAPSSSTFERSIELNDEYAKHASGIFFKLVNNAHSLNVVIV
jgi:hypothetical protein